MEKIRSFVAIEIPDEIRGQIVAYQKRLMAFTRKVRWVNPESMHITLKFLGEQESAVIGKVREKLQKIESEATCFHLHIGELGAFPGKRSPRVFWLSIAAKPRESLYALFDNIETILEPLGFEKEKRRFTPHLTLGRVKGSESYDELWDHVAQNPFEPRSFRVEKIVLMRSVLKREGAVYNPLATYTFK